MQSVKLYDISRIVNRIIVAYAEPNSNLEKELYTVLQQIDLEQNKIDDLKENMFNIANKL